VPEPTEPPAGPTKELVRLVELDYDRTSKFIDGVIGTSATIRGLLITAWIAVITLAFDTSHWTLAAVSFAVVVVFGLLDAYHAWLYDQALKHATALEKLSQEYHRVFPRGEDDPIGERDLRTDLEGYTFGIFTNIPQFKWKEWWKELRKVRPVIVFQLLYPALLAVSIVATVVLAAAAPASKCYTVQVQSAPTASAISGTTIGPAPVTVVPAGQQLSVCQAQGH
jgi:hypothetical protein